MFGLFLFFNIFFFLMKCQTIYANVIDIPPVIYVIFGEIPLYLKINIELAARRNPVVIISENPNPLDSDKKKIRNIKYENMMTYIDTSQKFAPLYKHLSRDHSAGRKKHELRCIQRWFILQSYMSTKNIKQSFFGDGDSSVHVNIAEAWNLRSHCNAVINVECQGNDFHWVGAGESSMWTIKGITEFTKFTTTIYTNHIDILLKKAKGGSSVVDMSILWLWFVAHKPNSAGWDTGRPWKLLDRQANEGRLIAKRNAHDHSYSLTKSFNLPAVDDKIVVCNGMDVVNRTVFDHMHGWQSGDNSFSLNLEDNGKPYVISSSLAHGGVPESIDPIKAAEFDKEKLYLNTIHYQGDSKKLIPYDVCRILTLTGDKYIEDPTVMKTCQLELNKYQGLPCRDHESMFGKNCA
jgi:hypothetical protein